MTESSGVPFAVKLPHLYCFAGSGATGKTSVVEALLKSKRAGSGTLYHPSIVREYYASRGVAHEASFHLMGIRERAEFQVGLLRHYMIELRKCLVSNAGRESVRRVVCDRSVFDHVAYMLYGSGELVTQAMWDDEIVPLIDDFRRLCPVIFHLPYPTGWPEESAVDGFRHRVFVKDFIVDSLIRRLSRDGGGGGGAEHYELPTWYSITERTSMVCEHIEDESNRAGVAVLLGTSSAGVCDND
mgnify:CR=1 FL=1